MDFLAQLASFIQSNALFQKDEKVLLTVSGGIDSVVLAHALHQLGYQFAIAHCNFNLRNNESDEDEVFVKQLALDLNIHFYQKDFDPISKSESEGISIQMAARDLRYAWFEELRQVNGFQKIVTAHHQNDVLETILLNLVRGTGIAGFHGIKVSNGHIVRPLLFATREEIENYASENGIIWREDSSNARNKYARNLIRNEVIPLLKQINPSLEQTIKSTTEKILMTESFVKNETENKTNALLKWENKTGKININSILSEQNSLFLLFSILQKFGFEIEICKQILDSASKTAGKTFYSSTHQLLKDRSFWLLRTNETADFEPVHIYPETRELEIPSDKKLRIEVMEGGIEKLDSLKITKAIFFDFDKLKFPILLRKWQQGDVIQPFGMTGTKKISDILIDSKTDKFAKENILVLESEEKILGIIGLKSSKHHSVDADTKQIWVLHF
jgi:tRNA(Ile)-lysidine synthase